MIAAIGTTPRKKMYITTMKVLLTVQTKITIIIIHESWFLLDNATLIRQGS